MTPIPWDRATIIQPGLYSGIPMSAYHGQLTAGPSISSSGLRTIFNESAAHYFEGSYLNPDHEEEDPSAAFILGRAAHHLLLGESDFGKQFVIRPLTYENEKGDEKDWNSNAGVCKHWLEAQKARGLIVLTAAQIEIVRGMAASLAANPMVRSGMLRGLVEHSMIYKDLVTGVWIKVRPDVIPTTDMDFGDFKTTTSVTDAALEQTIADYGYHVQGALVGLACRAVLQRPMSSFTLVFVEKTPPYCVRVKTLKDCDLALGEQQIEVALKLFARCLERGTWPGPGGEQTDAEYIEIPPWKRKRIEDRMAMLNLELQV